MKTKGNGNIISQEIKVKEFDGIALYGVGNIKIHFSECYKVIVTTDSNIQDIVEIEVSDNTLSIEKNRKNSYTTELLTVDVFLPVLKSIISNGAGNVEFIDGSASDLKIILSGSGVIKALNCQVQNADVILSGCGNIKLWVTEKLKASLIGIGDILYKGNPKTNINITGMGKVLQL